MYGDVYSCTRMPAHLAHMYPVPIATTFLSLEKRVFRGAARDILKRAFVRVRSVRADLVSVPVSQPTSGTVCSLSTAFQKGPQCTTQHMRL